MVCILPSVPVGPCTFGICLLHVQEAVFLAYCTAGPCRDSLLSRSSVKIMVWLTSGWSESADASQVSVLEFMYPEYLEFSFYGEPGEVFWCRVTICFICRFITFGSIYLPLRSQICHISPLKSRQ